MLRALAMVTVIASVLALCGFAAYDLGWFDPWLQKPFTDPTATARTAIENQINKEYTISVRIDEIKIDHGETKKIIEHYTGSELAEERGWTEEYLAEHFVVVWVKYYIQYDHKKTFMNDGSTEQYFYLAQDVETGEWVIVDNTSPST